MWQLLWYNSWIVSGMNQRGMEVKAQNQLQIEIFRSEAPPLLRCIDQNPKPSNMRPDIKLTINELSPKSEDIIEEKITNRIGKIVEKAFSEELKMTALQKQESSLEQNGIWKCEKKSKV